MNAVEMWKAFCDSENIDVTVAYDAWPFGDSPDILAQLVVHGEKTATASAYPLYEADKEPLPEVGSYSVVLDSKEEAVCVIQCTKVYVVPFNEVSENQAYKEGEEDKSLQYWRKVHSDLFKVWMDEAGLKFDDTMPVVCEEFKGVYK